MNTSHSTQQSYSFIFATILTQCKNLNYASPSQFKWVLWEFSNSFVKINKIFLLEWKVQHVAVITLLGHHKNKAKLLLFSMSILKIWIEALELVTAWLENTFYEMSLFCCLLNWLEWLFFSINNYNQVLGILNSCDQLNAEPEK